MEPCRIKTRTTARFSETLNLACSVSHCLTPAARTKTERSAWVTAVGTRASGADDWTQSGRQMARTVRTLPRDQSTDFSLLKLVQGMSWDGEGLGRRGRPPKVTLDAPWMKRGDAAIWWIIDHRQLAGGHPRSRQNQASQGTAKVTGGHMRTPDVDSERTRPILRLLRQRRSCGAQLLFWIGSRTSKWTRLIRGRERGR